MHQELGALPNVEPALERQLRQAIQAGEPGRPVSVLIHYGDQPDRLDADLLENRFTAEVVWVFHRVPVVHARVPASLVPDVADLASVEEVGWDTPVEATLDVAAPAVQALNVQHGNLAGPYDGRTAEALGYTGEDVVIAVLDTGIDDDHPAFEGKWVAGASTTGETTECVNPPDDDGHGTHVAGIALGNDASSSYQGAAPGAQLVEIKVSTGPVDATSGIMRAWEWILDYNEAIDEGQPKCGVGLDDRIDVATLSFGGCCPRTAGEDQERLIEDLTENGVVVTIAAGNSGGGQSCDYVGNPTDPCRSTDHHSVASPGVAEGAITVANNDDTGSVDRVDDVLADSSGRGPNAGVSRSNLTDRFRKPEIAAPGTDITAPSNQGGYRELSGTSMSTPLTAGIAALLIEAGEDVRSETGDENAMAPRGTGYGANGSWERGQHPIRDALVLGADSKTAGVPERMLEAWTSEGIAQGTWNNGFGYGEANAFLSLCWSWERFLEPAGATPPTLVSQRCPLNDASVDLSVNALSIQPANPRAGKPVEARAAIDVTGSPSAPVTVVLRLDGTEVLERETIQAVPANGEVAIETSPFNVSERGWHHVEVLVDTRDNVTERSEANNTQTAGFVIPIVARELSMPAQAGPGRTTVELSRDLGSVDLDFRCPEGKATLSIQEEQEAAGVDGHWSCSPGGVFGVHSTQLAEGPLHVAWSAAGTGNVSFELTGIPQSG